MVKGLGIDLVENFLGVLKVKLGGFLKTVGAKLLDETDAKLVYGLASA